MKFAHMSDCHIGSWQRTPRLADASTEAFSKAIDICVTEKVDFVLISGDLFDTSMPAIDKLKEAVSKLTQLRELGIPVYAIPGSHDFSPTGKTMFDVLEKARLFVNVSRNEFTVDAKTGTKIIGVLGQKGGLEKHQYATMLRSELEKEEGFKIFMFHSGIEEYKPKYLEQMEAIPLSAFPKGFDYYAGGHIHYVFNKKEEDYGLIAFPGPLFPNNFDELEKIKHGGFNIIDYDEEIILKHFDLKIHEFEYVQIDCNKKTPQQVELEILQLTKNNDFSNRIIGLKLFGTIVEGKTSDINYNELISAFYSRGAHCVLKNTYSLSSEFFEEKKIEALTVEELEESIIKEHLGKIKIFDQEKELELTKKLVSSLTEEKDEGERQADFDSRIIGEVEELLDIKIQEKQTLKANLLKEQ